MKRIYALLLAAAILLTAGTLDSTAQTQKGVVKTKGRMVNGQLQPGTKLGGAIIAVRGRSAVLSQGNGNFSFPVSGQTFMLDSVRKKGYQLVDAEAAPKSYGVSKDPLYVLMETPEQQMQDKLNAERKIRRTLQRQLQEREDEIEALKESNRITEEEYRQQLQQLYQSQENNEKLIADMAKRYSEMDFDQLDSLNRLISDAILNGRLTEADSLLRAKGDINGRIAEVKRAQQAEAQEEEELARRQSNLEASKTGTRKKLEDLAEDCYNRFELCKMKLQFDSAAFYIVQRAELDTMNAAWQFDAGYFFHEERAFHQAITFFGRALDIYSKKAQEIPQTYDPIVAITLRNMAVQFSSLNQLSKSEQLYNKALDIYRQYSITAPHIYDSKMAGVLNGLASVLTALNRTDESEEMIKEALGIYTHLARHQPIIYDDDIAWTLRNLAFLYDKTSRPQESEQFYMEALEIYNTLSQNLPKLYEPEVARTSFDLANLYYNIQRFEECAPLYKKAISIYRKFSTDNPQAYEPELAKILTQLAVFYTQIQQSSESELFFIEAMEIYHRLAQYDSQTYEPYVAMAQHNTALFYAYSQRPAEAETLFKQALTIYQKLAKDNSQANAQKVALGMENLATLYSNNHRFKEAEEMYLQALGIYTLLAKKYPQEYNTTLSQITGSLSFTSLFLKSYKRAEQYAREGLAVDSTQHWIATNLAHALLFQGRTEEAEVLYRLYKDELKDAFLDDFRQFAEAEVIPKKCEAEVERIKKMLKDQDL